MIVAAWLLRGQVRIAAASLLTAWGVAFGCAAGARLLAADGLPAPVLREWLALAVVSYLPALALAMPFALCIQLGGMVESGERDGLVGAGIAPWWLATVVGSVWLPAIAVVPWIAHRAQPAAVAELADLAVAGLRDDPAWLPAALRSIGIAASHVDDELRLLVPIGDEVLALAVARPDSLRDPLTLRVGRVGRESASAAPWRATFDAVTCRLPEHRRSMVDRSEKELGSAALTGAAALWQSAKTQHGDRDAAARVRTELRRRAASGWAMLAAGVLALGTAFQRRHGAMAALFWFGIPAIGVALLVPRCWGLW